MANIYVTNQAEFDALPDSFGDHTSVDINSTEDWIYVTRNIQNSIIYIRGSSKVVVDSEAVVYAEDQGNGARPHIKARGNSRVAAYNHALVETYDQSRAYAHDHVKVVARDSSIVFGYDEAEIVSMTKGRVIVTSTEVKYSIMPNEEAEQIYDKLFSGGED
jgi:hypothetical protein